jgi:hypothetical protein
MISESDFDNAFGQLGNEREVGNRSVIGEILFV